MSSNAAIKTLTEQLFNIRKQKSALKEQEKELNSQERVAKANLLEEMKKQGIVKLSNEEGSFIITSVVRPKVVNWEALYKYISDNNAYHLLHRRISTAPFEEMYHNGDPLPGVEVREYEEISMRKSK